MVFQADFKATWERHTACRCLSASWSYWAESNACKIDLRAIQSFITSYENVLNGFEAASMTEAVESANKVLERIENPFSKP